MRREKSKQFYRVQNKQELNKEEKWHCQDRGKTRQIWSADQGLLHYPRVGLVPEVSVLDDGSVVGYHLELLESLKRGASWEASSLECSFLRRAEPFSQAQSSSHMTTL